MLYRDCVDFDCLTFTGCFAENCSNGIDDNADGDIDCADSDCSWVGICLEHCSDNLDNDLDGGLDCDDSDCNTDPSCGLCYPTTQVLGCGEVYFGDNSGGVSNVDEYCSMTAALSIVPMGLAFPVPTMAGAVPWLGS